MNQKKPTLLVLGASSDIGLAIARKFADNGYALLLAGRNIHSLEEIAQDIRIRSNIPTSVLHFDATDFSSHENFVQSLPVVPDVTLCVFGYMEEETRAWQDWSIAHQMIQTNYVGAVSILQQIALLYERAQTGAIVGISSVAGDRGRKTKLIYGSSKAGFTAYLSGLRNRLAEKNIPVLTVKPGFVYTRMTEEMKLPPLLTAEPSAVAEAVWQGVRKKKNTVYVKWMWRYIMLIIQHIPEFIFKKMSL